MQMEARVGVVEGAQRSLNTVHGGVVDGGPRQLAKQQPQQQSTLNQQHSQIGTISHLLAGGIAGAVSKTCTAPLARLTILFQRVTKTRQTGYVSVYIVAYQYVLEYIRPNISSFHLTPDEIANLGRDHLKVQGMHSDVATLSKPCIWREASRVLSEEGFRAFWKGNLVTIAHRLPYSSISFYAYERYKNLLQTIPGLEGQRDNMSADVCVRLVGGGLSGITAASVTYPLDLVRTRLAAQTNEVYYRGISHTLRTICRDEGIFGLYKGLGATLLGVGPSLAISFSVYETLISSWRARRPHDSTILVSLACGSLSGIASSTATFPLDLVRRRMQLEGAGGRALVYKTGLFGTFGHIMRTEGLRGLYRGILPEYYKVVPSVGIVFMTFETIKMLLSNPPSND